MEVYLHSHTYLHVPCFNENTYLTSPQMRGEVDLASVKLRERIFAKRRKIFLLLYDLAKLKIIDCLHGTMRLEQPTG
jgi:hypothetical protein